MAMRVSKPPVPSLAVPACRSTMMAEGAWLYRTWSVPPRPSTVSLPPRGSNTSRQAVELLPSNTSACSEPRTHSKLVSVSVPPQPSWAVP